MTFVPVLALVAPLAHGFDPEPIQVLEGHKGHPSRGWGVAIVGDTNGDGYDDLLIGSQFQGDLYLGGPGGPGEVADVTLVDPTPLLPDCWSCWVGEHIVSGDWNGDGYSDVAYTVGGITEGWVEVRYGGPGSLPSAPDLVLPNAAGLASGDLDGDGIDDLFAGDILATVTGPFSTACSPDGFLVYRGRSSGLGTVPVLDMPPSVGTTGHRLVTGDFDGNGLLDVADAWEVYYGNGAGFHPVVGLAMFWLYLPTYREAAAVDIDGDGYTDLVWGNGDVHRGSATGLPFVPNVQWFDPVAVGTAEDVAPAGDVDGNGVNDAVFSSASGVAVLYGSNATPTPATFSDPHIAFTEYTKVAGGDVDGDGFSDVVYGSYLDGEVALRFGSPSGLVGAPRRWERDPQVRLVSAVVELGDIDGDGYEDVAIGQREEEETVYAIHMGSAGGLSEEPEAYWDGRPIAVGDVDGDGLSDVVTHIELGPGDVIVLHPGNAAGPGVAAGRVVTAATFTADVVVGDANGDGFDDVAVVVDDKPAVVYGSAAGLSSGLGLGGAIAGLEPRVFADTDGDGFGDLVLTRETSSGGSYNVEVLVLLGSAAGLGRPTSLGSITTTGSGAPATALTGDWNDDGFDDVAFLGWTDARVVYGSATGLDVAGHQQPGTSTLLWGTPLQAVDVTGDGIDDLVLSATREGVVLLEGSPTGLLAEVELLPAAEADGLGASIALSDVDGDGQAELLVLSPEWNDDTGRVQVFEF